MPAPGDLISRDSNSHARLKFAELTSGVGALVAGIGIGSLLASSIERAGLPTTIIGAVLHAFGMWDKHRIERRTEADTGRLVGALYWVCWMMLGGVFLYLIA